MTQRRSFGSALESPAGAAKHESADVNRAMATRANYLKELCGPCKADRKIVSPATAFKRLTQFIRRGVLTQEVCAMI